LVASDVHPNMVLEDVTELDTNKKLPWIFLRGDNISVIKPAD
jgi:small nuclear ribonucleoprotein (snRNP)-like protein